ncbi:MAG: hypothetical protein AB1480_14700 [Nitrospirota bacterium]
MPIRPENKHRYPANWKEIVKRIKERADNKCDGAGLRTMLRILSLVQR